MPWMKGFVVIRRRWVVVCLQTTAGQWMARGAHRSLDYEVPPPRSGLRAAPVRRRNPHHHRSIRNPPQAMGMTLLKHALRHEEVALCRRASSSPRGFEITVTQLPSGFWGANNIDSERYYNFHRRRNSEFFFADYVILTEGPIDAELVRYLVEDGGLNFSQHSVSIISLDSVNSLPHAYHLLKELRINFASVVDKDYFLP
jgi:hypothetical protein